MATEVKEKIVRDNSLLLDSVYTDLLKISTEIRKGEPNPALIEAFDALLTTYFDIEYDM